MSASHTGKPLTEEQRAALEGCWAAAKGKKRSPEFGRKVSAAKKGKTVISQEQRVAISKALTGRKQDPVAVAKRRATFLITIARRKAKASPATGASPCDF